jgi:DNA polymerase-4
MMQSSHKQNMSGQNKTGQNKTGQNQTGHYKSGENMTSAPAMLCRACGLAGYLGAVLLDQTCPDCGSPRLVQHPELLDLALAHIDCDAFYASVEKADNPDLRDQPVIVGGGKRGVVAAACYIARQFGVRSAMPSWQALQKCPDAVVIRPRMARYQEISRKIRAKMLALTPLVEPLSIDEAFLDLAGTQKLHRRSPAEMLAGLQAEIQAELGLTVSVGLSYNKSLAKMASDQDKPNGFFVLGRAEAADWLASRPVSILFGLGKASTARLEQAGYQTCRDLVQAEPASLRPLLGSQTERLTALAQGIDARPVTPLSRAKSLSAETTFDTDISDYALLEAELELLSQKVSRRLKKAGLEGRRVQLKLKTDRHRILTRSHTLAQPSNRHYILFEAAARLLRAECGAGRFWRLLGVGMEGFEASGQPVTADLFAPQEQLGRRAGLEEALEEALDKLHEKMGSEAIATGRHFTRQTRRGKLAGKTKNQSSDRTPDQVKD